jgi:hypothetical protein
MERDQTKKNLKKSKIKKDQSKEFFFYQNNTIFTF